MRFLQQMLLLSVGIATMVGCAAEFDGRVADVDPSGWKHGQPAVVEWQNSDTTSLVRLSIILRCDDRVPAGEIPLILSTRTPLGHTISERVDVAIQERARLRNGSFRVAMPYRADVLLSETGTYTFRFEPAAEEIRGFSAIGIRIEQEAAIPNQLQ